MVSKLFGIITPDHAFFGQKDAAQVAVIQAMVRDLNLPVNVHVCPTVRDADGLALSSRNRYLTPEQRAVALRLPQALACARRNLQAGQRDAEVLIGIMQHHLAGPGLRTDYVEVVDANTLLPQTTADEHSLLAIAAYVGDTRLIDNMLAREAIEEHAK